jgi:undecaprenyl-diphosphatase
MNKQKQIRSAISMLTAFLLWTAALRIVDVQAIGPRESAVGFATINRYFHNLTGVHMSLYTITDWLGLVPLLVVVGFALLGLMQWVKRKHIFKVDYDILILGGFYTVVMAVYAVFEIFVVNYRPVLIDGILEASYPSSTTMLVMCVMPTAIMQFHARIQNDILKRWIAAAITAFIVFMVIGRLLSGVHWLTDIIGGTMLSTGLVLLYRGIVRFDS